MLPRCRSRRWRWLSVARLACAARRALDLKAFAILCQGGGDAAVAPMPRAGQRFGPGMILVVVTPMAMVRLLTMSIRSTSRTKKKRKPRRLSTGKTRTKMAYFRSKIMQTSIVNRIGACAQQIRRPEFTADFLSTHLLAPYKRQLLIHILLNNFKQNSQLLASYFLPYTVIISPLLSFLRS